jgi:hypothetical protein
MEPWKNRLVSVSSQRAAEHSKRLFTKYLERPNASMSGKEKYYKRSAVA